MYIAHELANYVNYTLTNYVTFQKAWIVCKVIQYMEIFVLQIVHYINKTYTPNNVCSNEKPYSISHIKGQKLKCIAYLPFILSFFFYHRCFKSFDSKKSSQEKLCSFALIHFVPILFFLYCLYLSHFSSFRSSACYLCFLDY